MNAFIVYSQIDILCGLIQKLNDLLIGSKSTKMGPHTKHCNAQENSVESAKLGNRVKYYRHKAAKTFQVRRLEKAAWNVKSPRLLHCSVQSQQQRNQSADGASVARASQSEGEALSLTHTRMHKTTENRLSTSWCHGRHIGWETTLSPYDLGAAHRCAAQLRSWCSTIGKSTIDSSTSESTSEISTSENRTSQSTIEKSTIENRTSEISTIENSTFDISTSENSTFDNSTFLE